MSSQRLGEHHIPRLQPRLPIGNAQQHPPCCHICTARFSSAVPGVSCSQNPALNRPKSWTWLAVMSAQEMGPAAGEPEK